MAVWFTADTHFQHANIIELAQRPFASLDEMTERIIDNWNARVARGDVVYHLGDFALTWSKDSLPVESLLRRLNGNKHLICGNHDRDPVRNATGWAWVGDYKRVKVDGQGIVLFHYCIRSWQGIHRGYWHLYGHSHGTLSDDGGGFCLDVGMDCHDFFPVAFESVREIMSSRVPVYVDHHTPD